MLFSHVYQGLLQAQFIPLRFDLYHSKAGMSSMFNRVVLSLAQAYLYKDRCTNYKTHKTKQQLI